MVQYSEFNRAQEEIEKNIKRVFSQENEKPPRVAEVASGESFVRLMELYNPVIITSGQEIKISGTAYILSAEELIKILKNRYQTPGQVNAFPQIVEDFIQKGESAHFSEIRGYKTDEAKQELSRISKIITNRKGLVVLSELNPIYPVSEYVIQGKHCSGEYLSEINLPAVIMADTASFPFNSPLGARVTDGRREKNMTVSLENPEIMVESIENNIISKVNKGFSHLGDLITIAAILLIGLGIGLTFVRRGRMIEFTLPLVIAGIIIFWLRYYSDWGRSHFDLPPKIEISGNASMNVKFYGVLA